MHKSYVKRSSFLLMAGLAACGDTGHTAKGQPGADIEGKSHVTLAPLTASEAAKDCPNGGHSLNFWVDTNGNGTVEADEVQASIPVCNGAPGDQGPVGETPVIVA